ncbi:MAG: hypothetical protein JWS12_883 [Candidatus Saccharibacteria bacterium]|nr:hypothetical protein [Candidatus Saccharibacteria bacterium]
MKNLKARTQKLKVVLTKLGRWVSHSSLPEVFLISSFLIDRWVVNSDITYPHDMYLPLLLFAALVSGVYYLYLLVLRRNFAAHIASLLLSYVGIYAYQPLLVNRVGKLLVRLPHGSSPFTQSVVVVLVLALIFGLIGLSIDQLIARIKQLQHLQLHKILMFVIVFIFVWEGAQAADRLWDIRHELSYRYPAPTVQKSAATTSKPDIYFLMYEDYADATTLQRVNNYDNSPLFSYLASQGFANRQTGAYSNYPFTTSSLSSMLAMNYFPDLQAQFGKDGPWQTTFPYRSIINNPPFAQIVKQNGYTYNQVSSWWENSRIHIQADNQPTMGYRFNFLKWHFYLGDLSRDIINKSVLSPWLKKGITLGHTTLIKYDRDYNPMENLQVQTNALKAIANQADAAGPQFTFGHIMVPHTPYIFKPDGSLADYDGEHNDDGIPETEKYANQAAYVNQNIQEVVGYIRQHDPKAVVILQSDEGSYPPQFRYVQQPGHYFNPLDLPVPDMQQKFGILASYYLPGLDAKTVSNQLSSPVNVLPFVLNNYLGYTIPRLPECHFATGNKFNLYNYTLVTQQLTGQAASAACNQYK